MTATQAVGTSPAAPAAAQACCVSQSILGFFASLALPGLGQVLAGRVRRGMLFLIPWLAALILAPFCFACPDVLPLSAILLLSAVGLMIWSAIDAVCVACRGKFSPNSRIAIAALLGAIVVIIWVLADSHGLPAAGSLNSLYFCVAAVLSVVAIGLALIPSAASAGRIGLAALLPVLIFWPLDKAAQNTYIYMVQNVIKPVSVRGNSMFPNLSNREIVIVHKGVAIRRFDVVAFRAPGESGDWDDIKRVVGLPGETVEFIDGDLFINGAPCPCPATFTAVNTPNKFARPIPGAMGNPITLGDDEYYVLGDNRDDSYDSRYSLAYPDRTFIFTDKLAAIRDAEYIKTHDMKRHQAGAIPADAITGRVTWQATSPMPWRK